MGQKIPPIQVLIMPWNPPAKSLPPKPPDPPPKGEKIVHKPEEKKSESTLPDPLVVVAGLSILDAILRD